MSIGLTVVLIILAIRTRVVLIIITIRMQSIEQCMGEKKIRTGTYNLYVKQGYKFSLSCCNSHNRLVDNIGILQDRRVDNIC